MFSGIIETPVQLLQIQKLADVCKIQVQKPAYFDDIKLIKKRKFGIKKVNNKFYVIS